MKLGVRTLYLNMPKVEMDDRVCDGAPKDRQAAHLMRGKAHRGLLGANRQEAPLLSNNM